MAITALRFCIAVSAIFAALPAFAAESGGRVQVAFSDPQKLTDVRINSLGGDKEREFLLGQLREHLENRAADRVPKGERLAVTITDVDMAGDFEHGRNPRLGGARIVRAVYPPRIELLFELTDSAGKAVSSGKRSLTNLAFLTGPDIYRNDLLKYEKKLLDGWLSREFPAPR